MTFPITVTGPVTVKAAPDGTRYELVFTAEAEVIPGPRLAPVGESGLELATFVEDVKVTAQPIQTEETP